MGAASRMMTLAPFSRAASAAQHAALPAPTTITSGLPKSLVLIAVLFAGDVREKSGAHAGRVRVISGHGPVVYCAADAAAKSFEPENLARRHVRKVHLGAQIAEDLCMLLGKAVRIDFDHEVIEPRLLREIEQRARAVSRKEIDFALLDGHMI